MAKFHDIRKESTGQSSAWIDRCAPQDYFFYGMEVMASSICDVLFVVCIHVGLLSREQ